MADLGITHLTFGQTNAKAAGGDEGMRIVLGDGVKKRSLGLFNGITLGTSGKAVAIQNNQGG
jgi:hypothetical protein